MRISLTGMTLAGVASLATACASTEMHSFVDPEFRGKSFDQIMVRVQVDQLDKRDDAESIFAEKLAKVGAKSVRALDAIPPTRQYDDDEFQAALGAADADALLIIRMTEYFEEEHYVPPSSTTYTTGNLSANTYYYGNSASTYGSINSTSYTTTRGGHTYSKPHIRHEAQLWDVESGQMAWIGGTYTQGNAYARFEHLIASLATEVVRTLQTEGLVAVHDPAK